MFLPRIVTNQVSSIAEICLTCGTRVFPGWSWAPSFYSRAYCYSCLSLAPVPPSVCRMSPCCTAFQLHLWMLLELPPHVPGWWPDLHPIILPGPFSHSICRALQFLITSYFHPPFGSQGKWGRREINADEANFKKNQELLMIVVE